MCIIMENSKLFYLKPESELVYVSLEAIVCASGEGSEDDPIG